MSPDMNQKHVLSFANFADKIVTLKNGEIM